MAGVIISNIIKEEKNAKHQALLDNTIFAKIQQLAHDFNPPDLDCSLLADIVTLGQYIGPQVSKYTQTTQSKVDHHNYPSGRQVIKHLLPRILPSLTSLSAN
jgi:hypothetical protein